MGVNGGSGRVSGSLGVSPEDGGRAQGSLGWGYTVGLASLEHVRLG